MPMQCFINVKVNFKSKIPVPPVVKDLFLVLARNTITLQHLIINLHHYLLHGRLQEVRNKGKFHFSALKVVVVTYERWRVTRGFKYSDLNWKLLVFLENWSLRRGGRNWRFTCGSSNVFASPPPTSCLCLHGYMYRQETAKDKSLLSRYQRIAYRPVNGNRTLGWVVSVTVSIQGVRNKCCNSSLSVVRM